MRENIYQKLQKDFDLSYARLCETHILYIAQNVSKMTYCENGVATFIVGEGFIYIYIYMCVYIHKNVNRE